MQVLSNNAVANMTANFPIKLNYLNSVKKRAGIGSGGNGGFETTV
jgi:hypothetical protein